uniref:FHA domain-containing protein n=1 Tax=Globisporangium ultimum (strain ATCC 200006 / CBS 805.95 / DAOM BR144) TaxID=431595 RepID=K3WMS6_GLOUD
MAAELRPWGRFACISVDPAAESDHLYFYKKVNRIGRGRVDIVIDQTFISRVHCIVSIDDIDNGVDGGPGYSVVLLDERKG